MWQHCLPMDVGWDALLCTLNWERSGDFSHEFVRSLWLTSQTCCCVIWLISPFTLDRPGLSVHSCNSPFSFSCYLFFPLNIPYLLFLHFCIYSFLSFLNILPLFLLICSPVSFLLSLYSFLYCLFFYFSSFPVLSCVILNSSLRISGGKGEKHRID